MVINAASVLLFFFYLDPFFSKHFQYPYLYMSNDYTGVILAFSELFTVVLPVGFLKIMFKIYADGKLIFVFIKWYHTIFFHF